MSKRRVLVVEDEIDARELLVLGLQDLGYECQGAADGHQMLAAMRDSWDVLVLDIVLPGADGIELLNAVRTAGLSCSVVIMSSFASKERAIAALNSGADYLLEKPFDVAQLHAVLQNLAPARTASLESRVAEYTSLSPRERELVVYVLKGLSNEEVAHLGGINLQSAKNALSRIYAKIGVTNRRELFSLFVDDAP
ncbi:MAG: response regulator [Planctomycetota bacterium]|jgi:DNA-binding NarL/FixJ family response regulator|nr:response regulator [Planctomycetota bacterium]